MRHARPVTSRELTVASRAKGQGGEQAEIEALHPALERRALGQVGRERAREARAKAESSRVRLDRHAGLGETEVSADRREEGFVDALFGRKKKGERLVCGPPGRLYGARELVPEGDSSADGPRGLGLHPALDVDPDASVRRTTTYGRRREATGVGDAPDDLRRPERFALLAALDLERRELGLERREDGTRAESAGEVVRAPLEHRAREALREHELRERREAGFARHFELACMMHDSSGQNVFAEGQGRAEHPLEIAHFFGEFCARRSIMTSEVKVLGGGGCYLLGVLAPQSPGPMIRALRHARRLSQEELAHRAEVSTRHLSCLESGRAKPSHAMVLALGAALDLPLRERNVLLAAAGFAPIYRMSPLDDPCMVHVHEAVSHILALHEPHPAVLMDRRWNVLRMNGGAMRLFAFCGVVVPEGTVLNAYRVMFDPAFGLKPFIVNFDALADAVLARLRTECDVDPSMRQLLGELELLRGRAPERPREAVPNPVALPVHVRRDGVELRYFTTLTTLGTPLDVTAQELVIEGYFPMDEATRAFGRKLASEAAT